MVWSIPFKNFVINFHNTNRIWIGISCILLLLLSSPLKFVPIISCTTHMIHYTSESPLQSSVALIFACNSICSWLPFILSNVLVVCLQGVIVFVNIVLVELLPVSTLYRNASVSRLLVTYWGVKILIKCLILIRQSRKSN